MTELHSLLKRQLKRNAGALDAESPEVKGFIEDISRAYSQFDDDRTMLERSLELSSQELLQANSEMRAIFQALPDLYFVLNENGTILDCKGGSAADFLMPPSKLIGRNIQDVPQENIRTAFEHALQRTQSSGQMVDFEYSIANGSMHYYEARLVPLPGTNIMAIIRNISDRRKLEEQLRHSQKMEGIGTLAGGIAHDFNNILGIILGYASTMEGKIAESPEITQCRDAIVKASERGASLVRQMLTFARKTDVQFEPVNINIVVRELQKMLEHTFPRTVNFDLSAAELLPLVVADHNQIHQALLNLCVNAKDAMRGTGTISLHTEVVDGEALRMRFDEADADAYVALRVTDTGFGMDDLTRSRIFEPFFSTKAVGEGTGLGLAVVYGVVKSHRGFVEVASKVGKGSTFSLYFPVAMQETVERVSVDSGVGHIPDGNATILIVEDEELLRNLLKTVFERKGYSVLTAQDGLEAVEMYTQHKDEVSLVLTDIGLPKLDGRETYKTMKEINPDVKVILASGYLSPQLKANLLSEGAKDFIQKPYVPVEVLKKASAVLGVAA